MRKRRTLKELLDEKVSIVEEKLNKTPFEALGITEEQYLKMKDSSKYTRLCECLCFNGVTLPRNRKTYSENRHFVERFKSFLIYSSKDDRDSILSLIEESLSKNVERKRIQDEIKMKKGELEELERQLKYIC